MALVTPFLVLQLVMILIGSSLGGVIGLGLASAACVAASWLMRPWFEALPRKNHRRITAAPLVGYLALLALFVLCTVLLAPGNRTTAAMLLFLVWTYHSLYGSGLEPASSAYERLRGRLAGAAPVRVAVHWCGIGGLLLLLACLRGRVEYQTVLTGFMFTVVLAGLGASLKVFVRVRRLRTALDQHADKLILELEKLRLLPEEKVLEQQFAAKEAWGTLRRTLDNKVDTGFSISGVFVLPRQTIRELHHEVDRLIRAAGTDHTVHRQVIARLRMLRMACVGRTDTLT
ncbi:MULTISPECIES: hypothetical protein [Streptomyces]|uniref:hypothetical protein n=1 Tax=Streptomyces TaxID=1883 RepID=UPI00117D44EA|nr:hypothetical protein [Streptomyces kasugaensis]